MAENYGIGGRAYVAVLDMPEIIVRATFDRKYTGIAKFPAVTRDISMVVPKEILVGQIEEMIEQRGGSILESYHLFDLYEGAQIKEGHKSVAYSIVFRAKDRTLEDADVTKGYEENPERSGKYGNRAETVKRESGHDEKRRFLF